ncbi:unnamed protein product [Didymodactylos carnosus]|uniref:Caprin-1 dimerization domain-containing protein n=1 Tax=Didymodactylos carnosus TaxID=1234261 RepID=A0A8S2JZ13_9BILA|nr:unnamed protein product [Didymodactylos carnosus]CAF3831879.1 unnamed protein product [Didymodactylos carnosus]
MPSVSTADINSSITTSKMNGMENTGLKQQDKQQTQSASASAASASIDRTSMITQESNDPLTQAVLMLEKKQRNLVKRKDKLESYEQEAKSGKELNKDQKDALAKYGEVIGQIECAKETYEQLKKLQQESGKLQKRTQKQLQDEKRSHVSQRLREYTQLRVIMEDIRNEQSRKKLETMGISLKLDDVAIFDELYKAVVPQTAGDLSQPMDKQLSRCIEQFLNIYDGNPKKTSGIQGKTCGELKEFIEQYTTKYSQIFGGTPPQQKSISIQEQQTPLEQEYIPTPTTPVVPSETATAVPKMIHEVKSTPTIAPPPPPTPAMVLPQRQSRQNLQQQSANDSPMYANNSNVTPSAQMQQPSSTSLTYTNPTNVNSMSHKPSNNQNLIHTEIIRMDTRQQQPPIADIINNAPISFLGLQDTTNNYGQQQELIDSSSIKNHETQQQTPLFTGQHIPSLVVENSNLANKRDVYGQNPQQVVPPQTYADSAQTQKWNANPGNNVNIDQENVIQQQHYGNANQQQHHQQSTMDNITTSNDGPNDEQWQQSGNRGQRSNGRGRSLNGQRSAGGGRRPYAGQQQQRPYSSGDYNQGGRGYSSGDTRGRPYRGGRGGGNYSRGGNNYRGGYDKQQYSSYNEHQQQQPRPTGVASQNQQQYQQQS